MTDTSDLLEQLNHNLDCPHQSWLFGAGISKEANIPLMWPLTERVFDQLKTSPYKELLDQLKDELPEEAHIEHLLSQLGDYATLAQRSRTGEAKIGDRQVPLSELADVHGAVLAEIAETVRWGFDADSGEAGESGKAITDISGHHDFVSALFDTARAGFGGRRGPVHLFTTNYDTLLEDALALKSIPYWDGFSGGAVAFRDHRFGDELELRNEQAMLMKLHGSIDWHQGVDGQVWRIRYGDTYPDTDARLLIYPQSTKYHATQRDPFATQFDLLRRALNNPKENLLAICGYSFGDEHINQEIELALQRPGNKTTVIAFVEERDALPKDLQQWLKQPWNKQLYTVTEKGIRHGDGELIHTPPDGESHDWWTFAGVTRMLRNGAVGSL